MGDIKDMLGKVGIDVPEELNEYQVHANELGTIKIGGDIYTLKAPVGTLHERILMNMRGILEKIGMDFSKLKEKKGEDFKLEEYIADLWVGIYELLIGDTLPEFNNKVYETIAITLLSKKPEYFSLEDLPNNKQVFINFINEIKWNSKEYKDLKPEKMSKEEMIEFLENYMFDNNIKPFEIFVSYIKDVIPLKDATKILYYCLRLNDIENLLEMLLMLGKSTDVMTKNTFN